MISCNPIQTFHGGRSQSVLARTLLTHHVSDPSRLLVVAGDEPSESVSSLCSSVSLPTNRCDKLVTHPNSIYAKLKIVMLQ